MMKNVIIILCLILFSACDVFAHPKEGQNRNALYLSSDSLVKDFIFFCDMLEDTHPDPYTGFGGRPFFHAERDLMADRIADDSLSLNDFCDLLDEFLVPLKDLHTYVQYPQSHVSKIKYVQRIAFEVLNDGLMVSGIAQPYSQYLGSRLLAINGVPVDTLAKRMTKVKPSENHIGNLQNLSSMGNQDEILSKLGIKYGESVRYHLLTPDSDMVLLDLPIVDRDHLADVEIARLKSSLSLPQNNLQYGLINGYDNMMYFRLSSVMARENYKYCYVNGWNNALDDITYFYQSSGIKMPEDISTSSDISRDGGREATGRSHPLCGLTA